ncbi:hypothetical protein BU15DRAFT_67431 [Melanogaster broomeanus]|nr:hypothetical protein BU15DRAFT_67431 [Melanogaster broomeanus]
MLIALTLPDQLLIDFLTTEVAQDMFTRLENKFGNSITATAIQSTPIILPKSRILMEMRQNESQTKMESQERRVEKRDRRGKRAARWTSKQEAAVREPGEEATDKTTRSVSLTVTPISQDIDGKGMGAPCKIVNPQRPETPCQAANDAAAAAATGPGEEAMDQMASSISLVKLTSSQMSNGSGDAEVHHTSVMPRERDDITSPNETAARGQGEDTADHVADSGDVGVHCTPVMSQQPLANNQSAGEAATDTANPNATSTGPTGPAGAPCRCYASNC